MSNAIDDVKNKIDIVEYVGRFVSLKKAGRNFKAPCPFHNEKSPSFIVSPERQIWRCFGSCATGGDVISFLMKWENITFYEALRELAQQTGVKLDTVNFEDKEWKKKEMLLKINQASLRFFHYLLTDHRSGEEARKYLENRGMNKKLIETFQLGYAPKSWDSLFSYLQKKGFSPPDILESGLAIRSQKGKFNDRFRGRLMFPIIDARDAVIGFSGRLIGEASTTEVDQAKYVNTPETPIYHKRETLFGINLAKEAIRKEAKIIIVEGEFDMISCFKNDIKNVVAIKGSSFTKDQLMLIKRYTQHIVLALDADFSGTETTKRAIEDAEKLDFRVDIVQLDEAKDPDEALQKNPLGFKKALKKPIPIYDFIINVALKKHGDDDSAYSKKEISDEVIPFLTNITNPVIRTHYVRRMAGVLEISESSVESLIKKSGLKKTQRKSSYSFKRDPNTENRYELLQKYVLSMMFQSEAPMKLYETIANVVNRDDFSFPAYQQLIDHITTYHGAPSPFSIKTFAQNLTPPLQSVFDELFLFDASLIDSEVVEKDSSRSIYELKRLSLKQKIKENIKKDGGKLTQNLSKSLSEVEKHLARL